MRVGGRYEIDPKTGRLRLVEPPTEDHAEGNCARDAEGRPLHQPVQGEPAGEKASEAGDAAPEPRGADSSRGARGRKKE